MSSPTASASDTDWDSDVLDSNPGSHEILLISLASVLGAAVVAMTLLLGVRAWRRRRHPGAYRGAPMSWGGVASYAFLGERKGKAKCTSRTNQSSEEDTKLYTAAEHSSAGGGSALPSRTHSAEANVVPPSDVQTDVLERVRSTAAGDQSSRRDTLHSRARAASEQDNASQRTSSQSSRFAQRVQAFLRRMPTVSGRSVGSSTAGSESLPDYESHVLPVYEYGDRGHAVSALR
ncbi:hypothetical protein C8Q77DRAFT_1162231 [Trametes polyzona]|nr:hypothetical protein C8Q77DRAFT_1162231 [Trametes polyzona]